MTPPHRPQIDCDQQHTFVFVSDLDAAIDFYVSKLGFTLAFKWGIQELKRKHGIDYDTHASYRFVEA